MIRVFPENDINTARSEIVSARSNVDTPRIVGTNQENLFKVPELLWQGGYLWKIPYNGRTAPVRRIVTIKRENTKGANSRKCQIYNNEGEYFAVSTTDPPYISWNPPALVVYYIKDNGSSGAKEKHIRQLELEEGSHLVEGYSTPAFWKLSNRNGPMPRKEMCFSVVTDVRTLDLAADSVYEAEQWKRAIATLIPFKLITNVKNVLLWQRDNPTSYKHPTAAVAPMLTAPTVTNSFSPRPDAQQQPQQVLINGQVVPLKPFNQYPFNNKNSKSTVGLSSSTDTAAINNNYYQNQPQPTTSINSAIAQQQLLMLTPRQLQAQQTLAQQQHYPGGGIIGGGDGGGYPSARGFGGSAVAAGGFLSARGGNTIQDPYSAREDYNIYTNRFNSTAIPTNTGITGMNSARSMQQYDDYASSRGAGGYTSARVGTTTGNNNGSYGSNGIVPSLKLNSNFNAYNATAQGSARLGQIEAVKSEMFDAAHHNKYKALQELLQAGAYINALEPNTRDTVLMIACRKGYDKMTSLCLQYGAKNDPHPEFGQTALHAAVENNQYICAEILLKAAQKSNADGVIANLSDSLGKTPLQLAAIQDNPRMIELLLNHGATITRIDKNAQSCLHAAAYGGSTLALAALLDNGGDYIIDDADKEGNTCLHYAALNGHYDCVKLLLETAANAQMRNKHGQTASTLATTRSHHEIVKLINTYRHNNSITPMKASNKNNSKNTTKSNKLSKSNKNNDAANNTNAAGNLTTQTSLKQLSVYVPTNDIDPSELSNDEDDEEEEESESYRTESEDYYTPAAFASYESANMAQISPNAAMNNHNGGNNNNNHYHHHQSNGGEKLYQPHRLTAIPQSDTEGDGTDNNEPEYYSSTARSETQPVTAPGAAAVVVSPLERFNLYDHHWEVYETAEGYRYYLGTTTTTTRVTGVTDGSGVSHSQWEDPREYGVIHPGVYEPMGENKTTADDNNSSSESKQEQQQGSRSGSSSGSGVNSRHSSPSNSKNNPNVFNYPKSPSPSNPPRPINNSSSNNNNINDRESMNKSNSSNMNNRTPLFAMSKSKIYSSSSNNNQNKNENDIELYSARNDDDEDKNDGHSSSDSDTDDDDNNMNDSDKKIPIRKYPLKPTNSTTILTNHGENKNSSSSSANDKQLIDNNSNDNNNANNNDSHPSFAGALKSFRDRIGKKFGTTATVSVNGGARDGGSARDGDGNSFINNRSARNNYNNNGSAAATSSYSISNLLYHHSPPTNTHNQHPTNNNGTDHNVNSTAVNNTTNTDDTPTRSSAIQGSIPLGGVPTILVLKQAQDLAASVSPRVTAIVDDDEQQQEQEESHKA